MENDYYQNYYHKVQRKGIQGWGNSILDILVEKRLNRLRIGNECILELGASSGEHLQFVNNYPQWKNYVLLDRNPGVSNPNLYESFLRNESNSHNVTFVSARAEQIPYKAKVFDLVLCCCLLHHVESPKKVLKEMRRVTKNRGSIVIGMPTDPGFINQLIKVIFTYPMMKRRGIKNPRWVYKKEHINHIKGLIEVIKEVFANDCLSIRFFPLAFNSWNLNLFVICEIKVKKY